MTILLSVTWVSSWVKYRDLIFGPKMRNDEYGEVAVSLFDIKANMLKVWVF
jgi:hypothetical protein